jgi:hypothetical protein
MKFLKFLQEIDDVFKTWSHDIRAMKGAEEAWLLIVRPLLRWLKVAFSPQVLLLFILAIVLAALLIGAVFGVHLLISLVRKRRTRVFISFHHEREPIADALVGEMTKCGIRAEKLPFMESPDSDTLLDQVKRQILDCHIFICVPGNRPSFVEHEVSMAFIVEKPLLFILSEADAGHLPNTAKKGYPVFALEGLQREGFRTLANFCSYLAADWRSTVRLYEAVFHHLKAYAPLAVAVYIVSTVILTIVMGSSRGSAGNVVSKLAFYWFIGTTLILFLVPYLLFFITRLTQRAKVRRVICGKKFRDTFIPETLTYSLTGADLRKIFYHGDIVTYHESSPDAKSP